MYIDMTEGKGRTRMNKTSAKGADMSKHHERTEGTEVDREI